MVVPFIQAALPLGKVVPSYELDNYFYFSMFSFAHVWLHCVYYIFIQGFRKPLASRSPWLIKPGCGYKKSSLWLIKIFTFLSRFLKEIPNLRECG
jgi:hypothetical protein